MIELTPGSLFGGYRIESFVGKGGMGVVYRATQLALGRKVALKLIAPELAHDPRFRERFRRESRLAASVDHPNVIPLYEAGETDDALFISMRWVEGSDLLTLIKRGGGLDPEKAAHIVAQTGAALDAAHDHGLIHRDVKPANVLVTAGRAEHVYLTDFGLVKRTKMNSKVTDSGEFVGTLDYVAPEQIEGKAEACSDVYSLGCVFFHSLTGHVPFERDSEIAKIAAHLNEAPPSPSKVSPGLPPQFDEVVNRAMAKDRRARYETAGEMGEAALVAAASTSRGEPRRATRGAATAVLQPEPTRRLRPRRVRALWFAAAAPLLAVGVGAGILALEGGFEGSQAKRERPSLTSDGTLLKVRGDPGIYVMKSGAKFLTNPSERAAFFAGEGQKINFVSARFLDRIPNIPRDGAYLKAYGVPVVWVVRHGHRTPVPGTTNVVAETVPRQGLVKIPLRPTAHQTTLEVKAPQQVNEDQDFQVAAQARSAAGVPKGSCVFFQLGPQGPEERAYLEAPRGHCSFIFRVTNVRSVQYSVHFYGYGGWGYPTASTNPISVRSQ